MWKSHLAHGQTDESLFSHITLKYIAFPSFTIIFLLSITTRAEWKRTDSSPCSG